MATAKKQSGAAAPSAKRQSELKKITRQEKRAENKRKWREGQRSEVEKIQAAKPQVPERVVGVMGKSKAGVEVVRTGKPGRPSIAYTDELDAQLFELIVSGLSLEKISRLDNMPSVPVLLTWIGTKDHRFSSTYARAKSLLVPLYEERALDLATERQEAEVKVTRDGDESSYTEVRVADAVERSRLGVATYQWALGWLVPKKHGRQAVGDSGAPNEQLNALFGALMAGPAKDEEPGGGGGGA